MTRKSKRPERPNLSKRVQNKDRKRPEPKWGTCESCEQNLPIVPETGMCGPCTFGEADTLLTAGEDHFV